MFTSMLFCTKTIKNNLICKNILQNSQWIFLFKQLHVHVAVFSFYVEPFDFMFNVIYTGHFVFAICFQKRKEKAININDQVLF